MSALDSPVEALWSSPRRARVSIENSKHTGRFPVVRCFCFCCCFVLVVDVVPVAVFLFLLFLLLLVVAVLGAWCWLLCWLL